MIKPHSSEQRMCWLHQINILDERLRNKYGGFVTSRNRTVSVDRDRILLIIVTGLYAEFYERDYVKNAKAIAKTMSQYRHLAKLLEWENP